MITKRKEPIKRLAKERKAEHEYVCLSFAYPFRNLRVPSPAAGAKKRMARAAAKEETRRVKTEEGQVYGVETDEEDEEGRGQYHR